MKSKIKEKLSICWVFVVVISHLFIQLHAIEYFNFNGSVVSMKMSES